MKRSQSGFTMIEVVIVMGIIGILAAISTPYFYEMWVNSKQKESARNLMGIILKARSQAIATNLEYSVNVNLATGMALLQRGNRSFNADAWDVPPVDSVPLVNAATTLKGGTGCDSDANLLIRMRPNGTADAAANICVMKDGQRRFRVDMTATGRTSINIWTGSDWKN